GLLRFVSSSSRFKRSFASHYLYRRTPGQLIEAEDPEKAISNIVGRLQDFAEDGCPSPPPPIFVLSTWNSGLHCHDSKPQTRQVMKESTAAEAVEMKHGKFPQSN